MDHLISETIVEVFKLKMQSVQGADSDAKLPCAYADKGSLGKGLSPAYLAGRCCGRFPRWVEELTLCVATLAKHLPVDDGAQAVPCGELALPRNCVRSF